MQGMGMMDCAGDAIPERQGNWQGHVFPGTIFIFWATHWFISASWRHITATRAGRAYRSQSTEALLPMIPRLEGFNRYPVESLVKSVAGLLLFLLQITYGAYKFLVCPDGVRLGRLTTQHLNSWAHGSMNLGFSLSGLVELLGLRSRLPDGTNHALLSGAFLLEALLFSMHEKNGHLDQTIHFLLAQCCWGGAVFSALEAAYPQAFLLTAGRAASMLLQGSWFCQTARVLFGGRPIWDDSFQGREDEAPAMFLPMVFVYHVLFVAAAMVAVYAALEALHLRLVPNAEAPGVGGGGGRGGASELSVYETSRLLPADDTEEGGLKSVPLSSLRDTVRRS